MKKLIIILFVLTSMFACSRNNIRVQPIERKIQIADELYAKGKYNKAIDYYQDIVFEKRSVHTAKAQFYLAESYFNMKRYEDAIVEYKELIRLFSDYKDIDIAYFRIGKAYLEQSLSPQYTQIETLAAIDAFEEFLERFPFNEKKDQAIAYLNQANFKLLEKKFENGLIYYRLYDYSSALLYFSEIIELGNRNHLDLRSRYYACLIYIDRKDKDNAQNMLTTLQNHYSNTSEAKRIFSRFQKAF